MGRGARRQRRNRRFPVWAVTLVIAVGLVGMAVLTGCSDSKNDSAAAPDTTQSPQAAAIGARNTITVIGKAKVTSAPDEAVLTLSVENDGADAATALDANSKNMQKMIDRLKTEGLEDSAIETANVTVYPIRTYDPQTGKESLTGYRAQNTVTVTLKDALKVGKVLAAAVETGATNITGPEWRLSEDSVAVTEALKKAVADARTKAEAMAGAQGVKLGEVVMMNEGGVEVPVVPVYSSMDSAVAMAGGKVAEPPISAATLDITATITVTYSLSK
jgi:uncharacterized protein YggE